MAKFKVGDVVSVKREAAEMIDNPALARKRGRVTKVLPGGYYEVDGELGATGLELTDAELTLANSRISTNSVVRNAMAANRRVARNADDDSWVENYVKTEIPRLAERLNKEIAKQKESFAYWIDSDVLRMVRADKKEIGATSHKDRDKGIKALEDIEKHASSVIAQVERIR